MPSLLLKVGPGAGYEDGDILQAFNRRRIRSAHAERLALTEARQHRRDKSGLISDTDPARDWCEAVCEFRFERLSKTEVRITRLSDGETLRIVSGKPYTGFRGKREVMHVEALLSRAHASGKRTLFGRVGREVWYGGREDRSNATLDAVWSAIEAKLGERETDYQLWPYGRLDLQHHLAIPVEDFDDARRTELEAPLREQVGTDEEGQPTYETRAKREHNVDWRSRTAGLGVTEKDVEDRKLTVDVRESVTALRDTDIVAAKSLLEAR